MFHLNTVRFIVNGLCTVYPIYQNTNITKKHVLK